MNKIFLYQGSDLWDIHVGLGKEQGTVLLQWGLIGLRLIALPFKNTLLEFVDTCTLKVNNGIHVHAPYIHVYPVRMQRKNER